MSDTRTGSVEEERWATDQDGSSVEGGGMLHRCPHEPDNKTLGS